MYLDGSEAWRARSSSSTTGNEQPTLVDPRDRSSHAGCEAVADANHTSAWKMLIPPIHTALRGLEDLLRERGLTRDRILWVLRDDVVLNGRRILVGVGKGYCTSDEAVTIYDGMVTGCIGVELAAVA